MRLAELQAAVVGYVRSAGASAGADPGVVVGVSSARLGIYRDFVRGHIVRVLAKVYPYTAAALGQDAWDALALAYFHAVPATAKELNASVEPFAAWLDHYIGALPSDAPHLARLHHLAHLAQLAQIEWELFAAWAHEADVPEHTPALALNPTLALIETRWALVPWLVAHPEPTAVTPATPPPTALATSQVALVFRRSPAASHRVAFHVASGDLLFALKVVHEQIGLDVAAAEAGVSLAAAQAALAQAIDIGLVIAPAPA